MNEQPKTVEEQDFLEWCKQERIDFSKGLIEKFDWHNLTVEQRVITENFMICFDQLLEKQSDPAFIADIVRQTLEYVANKDKEIIKTFVSSKYDATKRTILAMHPEIVNNIINKK